MGISERVLGMPVSLSPLHKSIKEFRRAVRKVDSELKVCILLIALCCA
jgi:N-acetylated-alpha-linked acidic dipeptidase